ncbi:MAG: hypothetical protein E7813_09150 [Bradyrhizobium sp.]|uniref:hypothetical protein n=1 Tax=Bradyrhizobium sp. TaxID=376 RepID=UPI0011FB9211|nr:hypothetical protein [Bradyrhizobium sp.]THD70161.1 MAG: hypothetical protein E7813_09150 [Bradyrhizobium sp.]
MLRWAILFIFAAAIAATGPAIAADTPVTPHVRKSARAKLPPGLPRTHYDYRTTLTYDAPAPPLQVYVERDPDLLFTPSIPYVPLPGRRPFLPGSSSLPGYYGSDRTLDYQGAYYGGPNISYWDRLPYACGVYGYC